MAVVLTVTVTGDHLRMLPGTDEYGVPSGPHAGSKGCFTRDDAGRISGIHEHGRDPPRRLKSVDTDGARCFAAPMEPIRFVAIVRYWSPERSGGLAVADVPGSAIEALGGLKQQRVAGTIGGADFASNVMPAGGGRLAISVTKAMMKAAAAGIGDEVEFEITRVGRD